MVILGAVRPRWLAASLATIAWLVSSSSQGGELPKASDNVHASGPSGHSSQSSRTSTSESCCASSGASFDDDSDNGAAFWGPLIAYTFLSPFWVPHAVVEEGPEPANGWSIVSYPYADGAPAYFEPVGSPPGAASSYGDYDAFLAHQSEGYEVDAGHRRVVALQLAAEGMPPLAGLGRLQASARLQTAYRFELDASYALYLERGDVVAASSEWSGAWLGHAHAAYQFARGEHVQFRAGLGMRHWTDAQGSSLGLDVLYGMDIFWGRPVTTSLEFTGGSLGNAWVAEPRGTVGFVLGVGEIFVGYDAVWIGGARPTASLGGPVVGVRAYF